MSALSDIPEVDKPLLTEVGPAKLQKTDIFRKLMWFSYNNDNNWHSITCDRVREIQELNSKGTKPTDLKNNHTRDLEDQISKSNLELEILDKKFSGNKRSKKRKKNRGEGSNPTFRKDVASSPNPTAKQSQSESTKEKQSQRTSAAYQCPRQNAAAKPAQPKAQEGSSEQNQKIKK